MSRRFDALDSLRGLLACLVVVFHFWGNGPLTTTTFVRNGFLAVDFFFVLSGFVIAANYETKLGTWDGVSRFLLLRLGRVVPLHLAMLAALLAVELLAWLKYPHLLHHVPFGPTRSPLALGTNALLLQGLGIHEGLAWNAPAWSISAEVWTYVMFALGSIALGRHRLRLLLWLLPACLLALALSPRGMDSTYDYGLLRSVVGFAIGVTCWRFFNAHRPAFGEAAASAIQAACALAAIGLLCVQPGPIHLSAPFVMGALVFAFALDAGRPAKALGAAPIRWLGERSYSIYMVHWPLLTVVEIVLDQVRNVAGVNLIGRMFAEGRMGNTYGRTPQEGMLLLAVFFVTTLAVSAWTYKYIELPARLWSRRRVGRATGEASVRQSPLVAAQTS